MFLDQFIVIFKKKTEMINAETTKNDNINPKHVIFVVKLAIKKSIASKKIISNVLFVIS